MEMKTNWGPRSEGHPESVADFSRADPRVGWSVCGAILFGSQ